MTIYNCPQEGCNVHFESSLDDIVPMAINHAFGSHQKIIDRDAVVGTVRGEAQAGLLTKLEPIPVEKIEKKVKALLRKKRRMRRKKRKAKLLRAEKAELVEVSIPEDSLSKPKNKIFDWWKNKG